MSSLQTPLQVSNASLTIFNTGNCYAYTAANPEWEEISEDGMNFRIVAGNTDSSAVWVRTNKIFSSSYDGYKILEYDADKGKWNFDPTQPVGTSNLTVNSKGMPTIA